MWEELLFLLFFCGLGLLLLAPICTLIVLVKMRREQESGLNRLKRDLHNLKLEIQVRDAAATPPGESVDVSPGGVPCFHPRSVGIKRLEGYGWSDEASAVFRGCFDGVPWRRCVRLGAGGDVYRLSNFGRGPHQRCCCTSRHAESPHESTANTCKV